MLHLKILAICMLGAIGSGCAIHPLPQDVTGFDTYRIVAKIRCETRDAIRSYARGAIRKVRPDIADALKDGTLTYADFNRKIRPTLDSQTRGYLDKYDQSAIAYDFSFDITEQNKLGGHTDFIETFSRGPLAVGFGADSQLQRQNTRNFRVADNFVDLALLDNTEYCSEGGGKNWVYPITGTIGVSELVGTFLDLNQSGHLSTAKDNHLPTIADQLAFTTTLSTSANPALTLAPVGRAFQLKGASITGSAMRTDVHKVLIALTMPAKPGAGKHASAAVAAATKTRANTEIEYQVYRNAVNVAKSLEVKIQSLVP